MKEAKDHIFRIGIDARFYGPLGKGLGRYTQEIVDQITQLDDQNEYIIFLGLDNIDEFIPAKPNVKKILADIRWYGLAEQWYFPRLIKQHKIDLMHFPHFNIPIFCPVPFVVTIHDLILTKFPTMRATTLGPVLYFLKNLGYRYVINRAVNCAKRVIAVSEFTKQDIIQHFKIPSEKIVMIYEGVADLHHAHDQAFTSKLHALAVLSRHCILEPYLLYVGNAYPHKNLESLVRVFLIIRKRWTDLKLVLVGKDDYFYHRLREFLTTIKDDTSAIIFPGYVPDEDLQTLFEHAYAYIFPSKYEGFGLPPLEAMSRGCPVISSNATCLPEILGSAAAYFNPEDETSIVTAIERVLTDEHYRQTLISAGKKQATLYDWKQAAVATLAVYKSILKTIS